MIYIIGAGNMGGAIARVLAKNGQKVFVYDVNEEKAKALKKFGVIYDPSFKNLPSADSIILAVKPYHLVNVKLPYLIKKPVLISIAAGVKIKNLQKLFNSKKIVRVMPNLGLLVGQGVAGFITSGLSKSEKAKVKNLLNNISENFEVKEEQQIDAVTAISGSGPAYFFYVANALEKAAIALGFNAATARKLVEKTLLAAASLQNNQSYENLINQVASKKGTTEAALNVFKKFGLEKIISNGAQAAQKRAKEISNE